MIGLLLAQLLQFTLVLATFVSAARRVRAIRDRGRLDIALFMGAMCASSFLPRPQIVTAVIDAAVFGALPLLTLRLVTQFRRVPRVAFRLGAALIPTCISIPLLWGTNRPGPFWQIEEILASGLVLYSAVAMISEARRSVGVRRVRVLFVALGTLTFALLELVGGLTYLASRDVQSSWYHATFYLNAFVAVCYYLAFATPHFLTTRWRRAEQGNYLAQTSDREPEERGEKAADDLYDGASRCVGGSLAFVAISASGARDMAITAVGDPVLQGTVIAHGAGMLNRVRDTGVAQQGAPADCEPEVAAALASYGRTVLAAPIVANGRTWGVVGAVHRRGALFPEDDLSVLAQLGRNAATALDHAALIVERREEARRVSEGRLRELESRVGLMLDSIRDYALFVLDAGGSVAAWHPGAETVFGRARDEVLDRSAASLFGLSEEAFRDWLDEALAGELEEREGVCRRGDGLAFTGATTIRPLVSEPGVPPGFVVISRDVTERRSLEERLRQGQKMQAIGQLAGGVAHDFNNLLTAILGYADWLEQDLAGDPRVQQVAEIQHAAERAADLTRRLLAFSRKQMVQPSPLHLHRLVEDLLPMLRRLIGELITIVDAVGPATSLVVADRSQFEQVILNLVLNARDAMPDGGRITLRTTDVWREATSDGSRGGGPFVLLEVSDTGIGMDAETRRRAFEPFFTTKEVGRGTGLGLATVYGIVQQMDGSIEIDSAPGQGATFRVYVPHAASAVASAVPPDAGEDLAGQETVLLVEDDPTLRPYLVQVLERNGYHVISAESSKAALQLTEALHCPIDLVISDIAMPGRSGPELVAELLRARPGLPALYISGHADAVLGTLPGGPARGHLLHKPFSSTDLLAKVREILQAA